MPETITISYFNARLRQPERRDHVVPDLDTPTLQAAVDLFDAQMGTVLSVWSGERCLHRSGVLVSDLL